MFSSLLQDHTIPFDHISQFRENLSVVQSNGKYGVIDTTFLPITESLYDEIVYYPNSAFSFDNTLFGIDEGKLMVIDLDADTILTRENNDFFLPFLLNDRSFNIGNVEVSTSDKKYYISGNKDWGAVNSNGDTIVPFEFDKIVPSYPSNLLATKGAVNALESSVYDTSGNIIWNTYNVPIIPWEHLDLYFFKHTFPENKLNLRALSKDTFELRRTFLVDEAQPCGENCWIKENNSWHLMNDQFEKISSNYDSIQLNQSWGAVWRNGKVALFDKNGMLTTDFEYIGNTKDYESSSHRIVAYKENEIEIVSTDGTVLKRFKKQEK